VVGLVFPERGIGDGVVLLRTWRSEDAAVKAVWGADALIVRWTGVPVGYTQEQALAYQAVIEESRLAGTALGLATRAVRLLVDWAVRELCMERVQALVDPDNPRSAAVLERVGFQREGVLRGYRAGESGREDRLMYALLVDPSR
jgi:ribosomal protein S18 acetylase RimI-like enzyme